MSEQGSQDHKTVLLLVCSSVVHDSNLASQEAQPVALLCSTGSYFDDSEGSNQKVTNKQ
jgi:hypothetical protein